MNIRPRKRFGQNFLWNPVVADNIIAAVNPCADEHIVEIGPGLGVLTDGLSQCRFLDMIEIDRNLVGILNEKYRNRSNIRIHSADAIQFDFNSLSDRSERLRIVGNLPYNISTPLLFHLLVFSDRIVDMHFMLQKEVVDRLCAGPGTKRYGRLSVMMQYRCTAEKLFDVPPDNFKPAPKVMSSVVKIKPLSVPSVTVLDFQCFSNVIVKAFGQRRKTLRNSLKKLIDEEQIKDLGIDPRARAETLHLKTFAEISNFLHQRKPEG